MTNFINIFICISRIIGLTVSLWSETLEKAATCGAKHISVYDLQVEEGTAFGRWYTPGLFPLPSDEESAEMFRLASNMLKSQGFRHYEVHISLIFN